VRREIPVRTFADWCDPPPGFVEALAGIGTDNDSVFINETLSEVNRIEFTRCRPYRKNDQAYVVQKNGAVVRRLVGYRRLAGLAAARELARLYASARLFVNFFQPSFKLLKKGRDGAWSGSATILRRRRANGFWLMRERLRKCEPRWKPCRSNSIRWRCYMRFATDSAGLLCSATRLELKRESLNLWRSSWQR
jgi:hypothetical protein